MKTVDQICVLLVQLAPTLISHGHENAYHVDNTKQQRGMAPSQAISVLVSINSN